MNALVVDAHTHAFSADIIAGRAGLVAADRWFGQLYENPNAKLTGERELLESMQGAGIDYTVIAGFPWSDPGLCREQNSWMAEVCRTHAGKLGFLAIVVPTDNGAAADAERALADGALGIGELNADAQGFDLCEPAALAPVMSVCRDQNVPVLLHTSEPLGHTYPGKGTATPDKLVTWLGRYSEQSVVLAHWGAGLPFYELMPEVREVTRNVTYDSAATTYLYRFDVFQVVTGLVGVERVVLGSDFPVLGQRRLFNRVRSAVTDQAELQLLCGGNAKRVYGLDRDLP